MIALNIHRKSSVGIEDIFIFSPPFNPNPTPQI